MKKTKLQSLIDLPIAARFRRFYYWLRKQPAKTEFEYMDVTNCALARFGQYISPETFVNAGGDFIQFSPVNGNTIYLDIVPHSLQYLLVFHKSFGQLIKAIRPFVFDSAAENR